MKSRALCLGLALSGLALAGCNQTTGGARITFRAAGAGPDLDPAEIPRFLNYLAYQVTLSRAILHIGAIYLNANPSISTANDQFGCYGGGRVVGQVLGALDIDLLSREPAPFPVLGEGTEWQARAAAVWLTGTQRVDITIDPQVILKVAGVAERAGQRYPFEGDLTIGANRLRPSPNPATPGIYPICKERIVAPVLIDARLTDGGLLLLRVDPAEIFRLVDFSSLPVSTTNPTTRTFSNGRDNTPTEDLYAGLTSAPTYHFFWQPAEGVAR